jgi:hypothetical protein
MGEVSVSLGNDGGDVGEGQREYVGWLSVC